MPRHGRTRLASPIAATPPAGVLPSGVLEPPAGVMQASPRALPAPRTPFLLPAPADALPDINYLMSRQPHDMLYYQGKMRPAAEIMAACCAMLGGYARHTMLPAPEQPSTLSQLDHWARIESAILSPALQVVQDPSGSGFAVMTRRAVREGHALVRMPSRLALTADGAVKALPQLLSPNLEAHVSIAAWLMRLIDAPPARMRTYLRTLRAEAEVDCTLRWSDDDLAQLQTSLARSRAQKLQGWARAQHAALFTDGNRAAAWSRLTPPFNASYERWTWAVCAVWSRSFHLRCSEPTCGDAAGTSGGAVRVLVPGADLLNSAGGGREPSAVLIQPPEGAKPESWRAVTLDEAEEAKADDNNNATASDGGGGGGGSSSAAAGRRTTRRTRALARTGSAASEPRLSEGHRRRRARPRGGVESAPLAPGLSDVALGEGGGVWRWHESGPEEQPGRQAHSGALPPRWMEQSWFKAFCLHAVCLAEPDGGGGGGGDDEGWGAVSAVVPTATHGAAEAFVLRASRDLDAGTEVLLDYGPRPNYELLTTHGYALERNPHESVPVTLGPREDDKHGAVKAKILAAGNITAPFALSPGAVAPGADTDLLVALRVIAATPSELPHYADAFKGKALSVRNEQHWRLLLRDTVSALIEEAEHETSVEHDQQLLDDMQRPQKRPAAGGGSARSWSHASNSSGGGGGGGGGGTGSSRRAAATTRRRRYAALVCRLGEKLLLHAVRAELDAALAQKPKPIDQRVG